jgi:hypothetical protein
MLPFMVLSFYRGPVAAQLGGVDISFLVGLATSGTIYALLCRSLDRGREQRAIAASEAEGLALWLTRQQDRNDAAELRELITSFLAGDFQEQQSGELLICTVRHA